MTKTLILIAGRRKSGKDTFAHMLIAALWNMGAAMRNNDNAFLYVDEQGALRATTLIHNEGKPDQRATSAPLELRHGMGADAQIKAIGSRILHYANPLKVFCADVLGIDPKLVWGSDADKNTMTDIQRPISDLMGRTQIYKTSPLTGPGSHTAPNCMTVRELLQFFGTDVVRVLRPDAWVRAMCSVASRVEEEFILVPDVRFYNEMAVEAHIPANMRVFRIALQRQVTRDSHESETTLDRMLLAPVFDCTIPADATLETMRTQATIIAAGLLRSSAPGGTSEAGQFVVGLTSANSSSGDIQIPG